MARLVYFGDSFIAMRPEEYAWPRLLAKKYEIPAVYHAEPASNIEFTAIKLHEYLKNDYHEDDIIVTVLTSSSRAPIVHEKYFPAWSAMYKFHVLDPTFLEKLNNKHVTEHLTKHRQYYETWIEYFNPGIHQSMCYLITRTLSGLPNKKLVLSGFKDSQPNTIKTNVDFHPMGNLFDLSCLEYTEEYNLETWRGKDNRANHFTEENHYIMLDYVYSCLENGCTDIDYSKFKQAFYIRKS